MNLSENQSDFAFFCLNKLKIELNNNKCDSFPPNIRKKQNR